MSISHSLCIVILASVFAVNTGVHVLSTGRGHAGTSNVEISDKSEPNLLNPPKEIRQAGFKQSSYQHSMSSSASKQYGSHQSVASSVNYGHTGGQGYPGGAGGPQQSGFAANGQMGGYEGSQMGQIGGQGQGQSQQGGYQGQGQGQGVQGGYQGQSQGQGEQGGYQGQGQGQGEQGGYQGQGQGQGEQGGYQGQGQGEKGGYQGQGEQGGYQGQGEQGGYQGQGQGQGEQGGYQGQGQGEQGGYQGQGQGQQQGGYQAGGHATLGNGCWQTECQDTRHQYYCPAGTSAVSTTACPQAGGRGGVIAQCC